MDKLTLKDFIQYNNPCFNCGSLSSLSYTSCSKKRPTGNSHTIILKDNTINLNLQVKYVHSLNLTIDIITNSFRVNESNSDINILNLQNYLDEYNLYFILDCACCLSWFATKNIKFNFLSHYIYPLEIYSEIIEFKSNDLIYNYSSDFNVNESTIRIYKSYNNESNGGELINEISARPIPLSNFKGSNRNETLKNVIEKIKMWVSFS